MSQNDTNLPATNVGVFPVHKEAFSPNVPQDTVIAMNMACDHFCFLQVGQAWAQATSIDDIAKCQHMTYKAIKEHRDHLLMPNAHKSTQEKTSFVYPID